MNIEILTQPKLSNGEDFKLGNEIVKMLTSKKPKYKIANFMFSLIKSNKYSRCFWRIYVCR